jgi:putative lipoic acid-binding regulatory protein
MAEETLIEFPSRFPIKVFGKDTLEFRSVTLAIVQTHADSTADLEISERVSGKGQYLALTYTITAQSKQQLDSIYQSLTACEHVMMSL